MRSNDSATRQAYPEADVGQSLDRIHGRWPVVGISKATTSTEHRIGVVSDHQTSRRHRMPTIDDVKTWRGEQAHGRDGEKLGTIADIYLDRDTGEPEWGALKTGPFGTQGGFAPPAAGPDPPDGVQLPYTEGQMKDAP